MNSVAASLQPFPSLWINEVQPDNLTGITNSAGQHTGWLELYNPSTNTISLNGLYLANNYTNLLQWAFPTNAIINAGQFKVIFADGQTNLSTTNELHTSFILPSGTGSLALTRLATTASSRCWTMWIIKTLARMIPTARFPTARASTARNFSWRRPARPTTEPPRRRPRLLTTRTPGSVYTQNFDSLPDPGATSVNTDNPVTINGITYSLANPYRLRLPGCRQRRQRRVGHCRPGRLVWLGRFELPVWRDGWRPDHGGDMSFGLPGSSNRALGLLATSSTKGTAFGARFINGTASTLNRMNLQFTGKSGGNPIWPRRCSFIISIDPTGTNSFPPARPHLFRP